MMCDSEWTFLLSTNHSLILYGFGSRRDLLNDFAERELSIHGNVLVMDGYDSDISIGRISCTISLEAKDQNVLSQHQIFNHQI